ncbi:unnamed protein product, partial [Musa acuminata var. zebrina]
ECLYRRTLHDEACEGTYHVYCSHLCCPLGWLSFLIDHSMPLFIRSGCQISWFDACNYGVIVFQ